MIFGPVSLGFTWRGEAGKRNDFYSVAPTGASAVGTSSLGDAQQWRTSWPGVGTPDVNWTGYGAGSRAPSALSASCAAWNACRPAGVPQYTVAWSSTSWISATETPVESAPLT